MSEEKTTRRTKILLTACVVYLLLTIFYHHIDKYANNAIVTFVLTLLIPIVFIIIVVYTSKGLFQIFQNRKNLSFLFCLPTIIALIILTYTIFSPWRLDSECLESKVVLRACFEGTQNQAYIKLRQDKSFELKWTGVFGYNEWFIGTYTQHADTFYLHYETQKPFRFGDTIVNDGKHLNTINKLRVDSNQYFVPFYLGYCKGLN